MVVVMMMFAGVSVYLSIDDLLLGLDHCLHLCVVPF